MQTYSGSINNWVWIDTDLPTHYRAHLKESIKPGQDNNEIQDTHQNRRRILMRVLKIIIGNLLIIC